MATIRQKLATYAITISTFQQLRHFQRSANAELFIHTLARYRDQGRFLLHGFVVMPDHVHILLTPSIDQATSRIVQLIKGGYSHAVRDQSPGEVWHTGYHEHRIRDAADHDAQLSYIAANPSRKHLEPYPFVHTAHATLLDPWPGLAS